MKNIHRLKPVKQKNMIKLDKFVELAKQVRESFENEQKQFEKEKQKNQSYPCNRFFYYS